MPRYFFHYRTDDQLIRDTDGSDLPDLDAAEHNAAALAKAIVEHAKSQGEDPTLPRSIEITDSDGEELLYLVFWAGPKMGGGGDTDDEPALDTPTLH
ncbi:hypothetical protein [Devosia sp. FKR38]|uniref:DUF6894 family protein n=1 Tax=Devosia sp. FKR38 TaxID=2562312 RepID=UPI0020C11BA7|nr:hypothetical protein [Devosia sp. FKR38]